MEFYTSLGKKRPVRLCEETRQFAYESLNYKYGQDTRKTMFVSTDGIPGYVDMTDMEQYNASVYEIATKAPIRICENEKLSGAATLGGAIDHRLPAWGSIIAKNPIQRYDTGLSHLTVDFFEVLEIGLDGIRKKVEASLSVHKDPEKRAFLESCLHCIRCMLLWRDRYIEALEEKGGYEANIRNLKRVPEKPATNFYEAVQCIWFCFSFLRLLGCWPGIGRIDVVLGKYLKKDLADGTLTLPEAREILAHFFIKGCEWITGEPTSSGDAQHYQNLVLSGIDETGNDVTNEVTYLVLDIVEETGISDFPITVRINEHTDEALLRRVSEVISYGGGVVAIYNEPVILKALDDMGYPKEEAARFANDGCWEVQIPGKTWFIYVPFDSLTIFQSKTLNGYEGVSFESFDELLSAFLGDLKAKVGEIFEDRVMTTIEGDHFVNRAPVTAASLFEHSCVERAIGYHEGGPDYRVVSPHIGGLPDVVNSLYAIKKVVFEEKLLSFSEFMNILKNNWEGADELKKKVTEDYVYYGNDNDEVDNIAVTILDRFSEMCREHDGKTRVRFVSGVSTFGRQIEWAPCRMATPFGRKQGEVLSGNLSPTPGTDHSGATGVIKSYCKADLTKQHTGAALDVGFVPTGLDTENFICAIGGLIKSFCSLGGFFMQIDTMNRATLLEAQKHPENYKNLSVRVSGWNARFITMNKKWQDMVIERTK